MNDCIPELKREYRNMYIVDSLFVWMNESFNYCPDSDLVLTFDLALKKMIENRCGDAFFVDHLLKSEAMQRNNHLIYKFFDAWHLDLNGNDIFKFRDVSFGRAFQLECWNDFTYYIRLYLNVSALKNIRRDVLEVASSDEVLMKILCQLGLISAEHQNVVANSGANVDSFYFPVAQWMDEKVRPSGLRGFLYKARSLFNLLYGRWMICLDGVKKTNKKTVFVQEYHPTKRILEHLRQNIDVNVLLANPSKGSKFREHISQRVLPISNSVSKFEYEASELLKLFSEKKCQQLILDDGSNITESVYRIIENRVSACLSGYLAVLDSSLFYLNKNNINLEILISNIGNPITLFDCACESKNIPSYLIINGLLGPEYVNESKRATYINAYSESIKQYYFRGMDNIVVLGDPRMDMYSGNVKKNRVNREVPTVVIGASGFNNVDLNSYVAVEFDFMFDVLTALSIIKQRGNVRVIIKTRPNGYKWQYEQLAEKYFDGLVDHIIDDAPMVDVLRRADFYISIYSQTLFEASCLGVPVCYYKKDSEVKDPPFDGKSELVTASNVTELTQALDDFKHCHERYDDFLKRDVMEKYVGPLDGKNLKRNLDFVFHLLEEGIC